MPTTIVSENGVEVAIGNNIEEHGIDFLVPNIHEMNGFTLVQDANYVIADATHAAGLNVVLVHLPGGGMNTATFQLQ
jgi:hypothetical protein